ncbi:MAG: hypothetical protein QNJ48_11680 [Desulfobacterales bacterium]|nr:hypothetical protein [Desulfobacterales bacterium]MDJ0874064.1 hypothetical protein [Desulfobacterales bacterium]MDJ0884815.1 hypothetical protein [Desulfobacterales bacterium]
MKTLKGFAALKVLFLGCTKGAMESVSVIHPGLFLAIERFPERRNELRHLYASNEAFQTLCENYQHCSQALNYWTDARHPLAAERHREYSELMSELEMEILQYFADTR